MPTKGTYFLIMSGPRESRDGFLAELAAANIAAHATRPGVAGDDEAAKGWVEAEFHEGTDMPPTLEFQAACMERVIRAGEGFDYAIRAQGDVVGGQAEWRQLVHKPTGHVITEGNIPTTMLPMLAVAVGIEVENLELREPPGAWDIPVS